MAKNKKLLLTVLSVALVAIIGIFGTIAYLTDTDSDVNVMTMGNVAIEQHEYERVVDADGEYATKDIDNQSSYVLKDFTQAKPLIPIVGDPSLAGNDPEYAGWDATTVRMSQVDSYGGMTVFAGKNAQDKFVTVENTGKSDAYVRTFVAIEVGTGNAELIGTSYHMAWSETFVATISIDGNNYAVFEYLYKGAQLNDGSWRHENGVLPAKDTTYPNLSQVYISSKATNEDVEALDGDKDGLLSILVLSQAVQVDGFTDAETALETAFPKGDNNANVGEWFGAEEFVAPEVLGSFEDLLAANNGSDGNYVLSDDIDADDMFYFYGTDVTLNLNGKTITAENRDQYLLAAPEGSTLHLTGEGIVDAGKGFFATGDGAEIIVDGGTYNTTKTGTLNNIKHTSLAQNNAKIVINGGTYTTDVADAVLFFATSNAVIEVNGGFFENTANKTPDLFSMGTNKYNTNRIIFKGGTFVNWNPLGDRMCYTGEWPASYEQFSGPWMLVWDGYKVVSETQANGDVWYTVVPE